jgi:hypothetical protein
MMLIRVSPQDLLEELIDALVAADCLVLRVSPGICRVISTRHPGANGRTDLRFFLGAWANSRSATVDVAA